MPCKMPSILLTPRIALLALEVLTIFVTTVSSFPGTHSFVPRRNNALTLLRTKLRAGGGTSPSTNDGLILEEKKVDLCIIGGGVSGLTAAITAADGLQSSSSILLLEADTTLGGRVRSDRTPDGFTLDRGFAVFIEEYPTSKKLLDYDALGLARFLPGARVKLRGTEGLAAVSDPLRRPQDLIKAVTSPVGTLMDKLKLIPLFFTVTTKTVEELFEMEETDVRTCLEQKYGFSTDFISEFFCPFFEGIYLASLGEQSSRMFHFVFRMFTVGSASLPAGGMQSIADQLAEKGRSRGVNIRVGTKATSIIPSSNGFAVEISSTNEGKRTIKADSIVLATDVSVTQKLLAQIEGLDQTNFLPELSQRSVGCMYYAFSSPIPLEEPILVLNGEGEKFRNKKKFPINNVCFPSVVQRNGYAPEGYELCSVVILEAAMELYDGDEDELDVDVRKQLSQWFPNHAKDILDESTWVRKGFYAIKNAQPVHYKEEGCANLHGGRDCSTFRGGSLPKGMFASGDHMATATLNGALESGIKAGEAAARFLASDFQ